MGHLCECVCKLSREGRHGCLAVAAEARISLAAAQAVLEHCTLECGRLRQPLQPQTGSGHARPCLLRRQVGSLTTIAKAGEHLKHQRPEAMEHSL